MDQEPKYTTTKAAHMLGITPGRARVIRKEMGLGKQLGRDWLLSDADIERMRQRDTTPGPKPKSTPPTEATE